MTISSTSNNIAELGELSSQFNGAIDLPASLFEQIDDHSNIGVFFAFYELSSLFPVAGESNSSSSPMRKVVISQILAATVGSGIDFQNLTNAVTISFRLQVPRADVSSSNRIQSRQLVQHHHRRRD